jgi:hypothetical protein
MLTIEKQTFIKTVVQDFLLEKFAYSLEEIQENLKITFDDSSDYSIEFSLESRHSQQIDLYDIVRVALKYSKN